MMAITFFVLDVPNRLTVVGLSSKKETIQMTVGMSREA